EPENRPEHEKEQMRRCEHFHQRLKEEFNHASAPVPAEFKKCDRVRHPTQSPDAANASVCRDYSIVMS
ncbi:MAG: hypothetical protein VX090_14650, partial [Pseudomonadota bacterium]|nr:hypothetical protein [Pseudomonadota bacterium]